MFSSLRGSVTSIPTQPEPSFLLSTDERSRSLILQVRNHTPFVPAAQYAEFSLFLSYKHKERLSLTVNNITDCT
jgi:hypothetical protein